MNITFKSLLYLYQRATRGWADCDAWDAHSYFNRIIPQVMRELKRGTGCPSEFYDKKNINNECKKWTDTLEEIAQGFEAAQFLDSGKYVQFKKVKQHYELVTDYEALENAKKKMERGLELFAKYYLNLWD